jgi:phage shock protein A
MTTSPTQPNATLLARIAKLEQLLEDLRSEPETMDDETNAVERDLQALRRKLAEAQ